MSEKLEIGGFNVKSCLLKKWDESKVVDIKNLVAIFRITESIYNQVMNASLIVYDAIGLHEDFPLIGEEYIEITYEDIFGVEMTNSFHVYSMSELDLDSKGEGMGYILSLVSRDFVKSESTSVRKSYRGSLSESIKDLFEEYLNVTGKPFEVEESSNQFTLVIPSLSPFSAMNLLSRKAFSTENKSSNFFLFENRQKYRFISQEKMILDGKRDFPVSKKYTYKTISTDVNDRMEYMNNIITFGFPKKFDLLGEFKKSSAVGRNVTVDLAVKNYETSFYDYFENFEDYTHLDEYSKKHHTENFSDEFFPKNENTRSTNLIFEDSGNGGDRHYGEIISNRISNRYYLNSIQINMEAYGRNDIFAGDIIEVKIPNFQSKQANVIEHSSLSGFYLVEKIIHVMTREDGKWIMHMSLLKDAPKKFNSSDASIEDARLITNQGNLNVV